MRDAIAGNAPGRPRHGLLPQVSALIRPHWPVLSRRLLITAGAFFPVFLPGLAHKLGHYSFPSGHVLRATMAYGLVLYLAERWELFGRDSSRLSPILVLVVFFVGYAVVYLGWHWLSDALGGLLLGLTLLFGLIAYLERKRMVNPGHEPD